MSDSQTQAPITYPVHIEDVYNYIKTFAIHEMAKAEKILHAAHRGDETDIVKIAAQGARSLAQGIFQALTDDFAKALHGTFNFKKETADLIEGIREIDPFLVNKVYYLQMTRTPAPTEGTPVTDSPSSEEIDASVN